MEEQKNEDQDNDYEWWIPPGILAEEAYPTKTAAIAVSTLLMASAYSGHAMSGRFKRALNAAMRQAEEDIANVVGPPEPPGGPGFHIPADPWVRPAALIARMDRINAFFMNQPLNSTHSAKCRRVRAYIAEIGRSQRAKRMCP